MKKEIVVCRSLLRGQAVDDEDPESDVVVLRHVHHQPPPLIHLVKLLLHPIAVSRPPAISTIIARSPCVVGISEVVDGTTQRREKMLARSSPTLNFQSVTPDEQTLQINVYPDLLSGLDP